MKDRLTAEDIHAKYAVPISDEVYSYGLLRVRTKEEGINEKIFNKN